MKLALLGEDIGYSLSAEIHNFSAQVLGVRASYKLLDIRSDDFLDTFAG